jgi:hypothetical protein
MLCILPSPRAPFKEAKEQRGDRVQRNTDACSLFPVPYSLFPALITFDPGGGSRRCLAS